MRELTTLERELHDAKAELFDTRQLLNEILHDIDNMFVMHKSGWVPVSKDKFLRWWNRRGSLGQ